MGGPRAFHLEVLPAVTTAFSVLVEYRSDAEEASEEAEALAVLEVPDVSPLDYFASLQ